MQKYVSIFTGIITIFFISACTSNSQGTQIISVASTPLDIETVGVQEYLLTETPTRTPTTAPTATPTPLMDALNVDNYKIVEGNIEEKRGGTWQAVDIPYEAGYIAYVEINEGQAYGIDTADRAVVVRNESGEWVKFERPVFGSDFSNFKYTHTEPNCVSIKTYKINPSSLNLTDISIENLNRLKTIEGNPVAWGYEKNSYNWNGFSTNDETDPLPIDLIDFFPFRVNVSGYFLGKTEATIIFQDTCSGKETVTDTGQRTLYAFEIPYKYFRQVIIIQPLQSVHGSVGFNLSFGDFYGDIAAILQNFSAEEYKILLDENINYLYGRQVVINIEMAYSDEGRQEFWKSLYDGIPYDNHMVQNFGSEGINWFSGNLQFDPLE